MFSISKHACKGQFLCTSPLPPTFATPFFNFDKNQRHLAKFGQISCDVLHGGMSNDSYYHPHNNPRGDYECHRLSPPPRAKFLTINTKNRVQFESHQ